MFTKTEAKIMKVFASKIDRKFSIKEIAELLDKPYPLIHRSVMNLLKGVFIVRDEKELLSLNYKENHSELAYIEALRSKEVLSKDKSLSLFVKDFFNKVGIDFFVFMIFGSYIEKSNSRDIDVLIIVENESYLNEIEKILINIGSHFTKKFDFQVISIKSAYEMLSKRDKINILNESLNKHIFLYGAENYYRILQNAR